MTPIRYSNPFVFHFRNEKHFEKGGLTIVFDPQTRMFAATECSKRDHYNKKRGVEIAMGRIRKWCQRPNLHLSQWILGTLDKNEMFVENVRNHVRQFAARRGFASWALDSSEKKTI